MAITQANKIYHNAQYYGDIVFAGTVALPSSTVENADVKSDADIGYAKLQHVHHVTLTQADGSAVADESRVVFIARAPCTVLAVECALLTVAAGDSTVDVDVQQSTGGGAFASILTAAESLDSSTVVRTVVEATLDGTPTLADGDMLLIDIDATAGTGTLPQGLIVDVTIAEEGQ